MLEIEKFRVGGKSLWVALIHEDGLVLGLSLSLGGTPNVGPLVSFLRRRGVKVSLEPGDGSFLQVVKLLLLGSLGNEETFNVLDTSFLTPFERRVYSLVVSIPRGSIVTYGWLAKKLGTSPRAIGGALGRNPYPVFVPCHRVVSKGGLGGFSTGLKLKKFLLKLEGVNLWQD